MAGAVLREDGDPRLQRAEEGVEVRSWALNGGREANRQSCLPDNNKKKGQKDLKSHKGHSRQ